MKKAILKTIFIFALLIGGMFVARSMGADNDNSDIATLLAVAPIAAVGIGAFNMENLKIPIAEFEKLKAKYGRLYVINIEIDEDETYQFIVIRPTREVLSAVNKYKHDEDKANDVIIKNMVVGGDLDAINDGLVYANLMKDIGAMIRQGQSSLMKA